MCIRDRYNPALVISGAEGDQVLCGAPGIIKSLSLIHIYVLVTGLKMFRTGALAVTVTGELL